MLDAATIPSIFQNADLVPDCSDFIADLLEILQSCTKPSWQIMYSNNQYL